METSSHSPCSWHKWEQPCYSLGQDIRVGGAPAMRCTQRVPGVSTRLIFPGTPLSWRHRTPVLAGLGSWLALGGRPGHPLLQPSWLPFPRPGTTSSFQEKRAKRLSASLPIA